MNKKIAGPVVAGALALFGNNADAYSFKYSSSSVPSGSLEVKLENVTQNAPSVAYSVYLGDNSIYFPAPPAGSVTSLGVYSKEPLPQMSYEFSSGVSMLPDANSLPGLNQVVNPYFTVFEVVRAEPPVFQNGINSGTTEYAKIFMENARERYTGGSLGIGVKMQGLPPANYSDTYFNQIPEPKETGAVLGGLAALAAGLNFYRKRKN